MWNIVFRRAGEEGRTRQLGKVQVNGTFADALVMAQKVLRDQPQNVQKAIAGLQIKQESAAATGPVKFKL